MFSRFSVTSKNGSSRSIESSWPVELMPRDVVRDAYDAAVMSRRWEPLLHVGDAQWRVEQASGFATLGKASARANSAASA